MLINTLSNIYSTQASSSTGRTCQSNAHNVSGSSDGASTGPVTSANLDFTNMTPRDLNSKLGSLVTNGKITFDDSGILIVMIPTPLSKVNYDGKIPETYDQPMNFMARLQDGIEFAKSRNDVANVETFTKALSALQ